MTMQNANTNSTSPITALVVATKALVLVHTGSDSWGRPSLRPGAPGGSEEPHPQAGTRAYLVYVEESDSASEASWKEASCKDAATTKVYT
jgi:hypothetical protein